MRPIPPVQTKVHLAGCSGDGGWSGDGECSGDGGWCSGDGGCSADADCVSGGLATTPRCTMISPQQPMLVSQEQLDETPGLSLGLSPDSILQLDELLSPTAAEQGEWAVAAEEYGG